MGESFSVVAATKDLDIRVGYTTKKNLAPCSKVVYGDNKQ